MRVICYDCYGTGEIGVTRDNRVIACETCGGHEDELGTGRVDMVCAACADKDAEIVSLRAALEAVHPLLYGLLLEKWGDPQGWRTNTVGYQMFHQLLCALGLCEHRDCQHCAALPSDIDSGMSG